MITYIEYDEEEFTLFVEFKNGDEYQYSVVPKETYYNLVGSSSIGRYFIENIKNEYEFEKL